MREINIAGELPRIMYRVARAGALSSAVWIGVAIAVATGCRPTRPELELPVLPEAAAPRELTADQQIRQALSRLTFGPLPHESQGLTGRLDQWLQRQLTPDVIPDPAVDSMIAAHPLLGRSAAELVRESPPQDIFLRQRRRELGLPDTAHYVMTADDSLRFKAMNDLGNRRVQEILGAQFARAALSDRQVLEVMTQFWENHFSVFTGKMPTRFTLLAYDRESSARAR